MASAAEIYRTLRDYKVQYDEDKHCTLILEMMIESGRYSAFCTEAGISEDKFHKWVIKHELFRECYSLGKMYAREAWEKEGLILRERESAPGTIDHAFDHWRLTGWSRFGISKNNRIRLELNPDDAPNMHYAQLLKQASNGDFTAAEIKQLMEAINVGLNTHQVITLQKEINDLKSDLDLMKTNSNVHNTFSDQTTPKTD
jgi:hypothetical protein